jgi:hypothetical protein
VIVADCLHLVGRPGERLLAPCSAVTGLTRSQETCIHHWASHVSTCGLAAGYCRFLCCQMVSRTTETGVAGPIEQCWVRPGRMAA